MTRADIPTKGRNRLTERLLAQGVKPDDMSTWPENVWRGDINNFCYKREWIYTPTYESPCGLLIHSFGQFWGECQAGGEFHCDENDNPLFRCPKPGAPCPHRLKLPPGINCQFHRTDRIWQEDGSYEQALNVRNTAERALWEDDLKRYEGFDGMCINVHTEDMPDGSVRRAYRYDVSKCISMRCENTVCVCRRGARRNTQKVNIFYDLYIERRYMIGVLPQTDRQLIKGLGLFDKPVARTDAEIALKMWRQDPDGAMIPAAFQKLNVTRSRKELHREEYFARHHRCWDGKTEYEITVEIRDIRIEKSDKKDLIKDLEDVAAGIQVTHDSDRIRAAVTDKAERRKSAKIEKAAKQYARGKENGRISSMTFAMLGVKDEDKDEVRARAEAIVEKNAKARQIEASRGEQLSLFDMDGE